jgi:hypothetical protein
MKVVHSEIYIFVVRQKSADVSEEGIASIFGAEKIKMYIFTVFMVTLMRILVFYREDGGITFLQAVGKYL